MNQNYVITRLENRAFALLSRSSAKLEEISLSMVKTSGGAIRERWQLIILPLLRKCEQAEAELDRSFLQHGTQETKQALDARRAARAIWLASINAKLTGDQFPPKEGITYTAIGGTPVKVENPDKVLADFFVSTIYRLVAIGFDA